MCQSLPGEAASPVMSTDVFKNPTVAAVTVGGIPERSTAAILLNPGPTLVLWPLLCVLRAPH